MMTDTARWFPEQPPMLYGEDPDAYTNRLTGADKTDRIPYDHRRFRECSLGYHETCSQRDIQGLDAPVLIGCQCPCHTARGALELRVRELEESVVALYAVAADRLRDQSWRDGILSGSRDDVERIVAARAPLAEWYLRPATDGANA